MGKIAAAACAATLALAVTGGAAAATTFTGGSVAGSGSVDTTFEGSHVAFQVTVGARGDAFGATGHLAMRFGTTVFQSQVRCVLVAGNSALVVGTLREPEGAATELIAEFVDNGNGRDAPPDATVAGLSAPSPFFDACFPTFVGFTDAFPVEHGNYVVRPEP